MNRMLLCLSHPDEFEPHITYARTHAHTPFPPAAGVAPDDVELPEFGQLWHGSPLSIGVPTGYSVTTYPDWYVPFALL
jgi:hypothetical protein